MEVTDALEALLLLAEIAFVGRVVLAFLPPGLPGRHGLADLPATWAASHMIGRVAFDLQARLALPRLALLAFALLLLLVRFLTLPAAMVPRHEPLARPPGSVARLLALAAPAAVVAAAATRGVGRILPAADSIALLGCCAFALAASRRSPAGGAPAALVLASGVACAVAWEKPLRVELALGVGAGAAFAAVWLRRGDRRAALLSVIAFASCAFEGPREAVFGAAGLFALWNHTPQ